MKHLPKYKMKRRFFAIVQNDGVFVLAMLSLSKQFLKSEKILFMLCSGR